MSLEQAIKEMEKELEEATKKEASEEEEQEKEPVKEEEKKEEPEAVEEKQPEPEKSEDTDKGAARLRVEAAAARKRAEALEQEVAELKKALEAPKSDAVDYAPEQKTVPDELQEIIRDYNYEKAKKEFYQMEIKVAKENPDYEDVSKQYRNKIFDSIKSLNFDLSDEQVAELTTDKILKTAGQFLRDGYENPVEELYHLGKKMGFSKIVEVEQKEVNEPKPARMEKVLENRKKSSGMTGASGEMKSGLPSAKYAAENYTAADIAKLSPEQFNEMLRQLNG